MQKVRWGILGTGAIAAKFAAGLAVVDDAEVVAVGSRTRAGAEAFGAAHGIPRRHGSYAELAADPGVDVVYVATPHPMHRDDTLACLDAGPAVLCEKPLAMNAAQGRAMFDRARARGTFLLEAMWTRFLPAMVELRRMQDAGELGDVRLLSCDFGFRADFDPRSRLFDPVLGGGALLDVGVYCVALARMLFRRPPAQLAGVAHFGATGVDEQCAWTFLYEDGALATQSAAVRTDTPQEALVVGTRRTVRIPRFWCPEALVVDGEERPFPFAGNGYHCQALEVARCLRAGLLESPVLPWAESLEILETMDRLRAAWGLSYPCE